jgi:hypothetical protein
MGTAKYLKNGTYKIHKLFPKMGYMNMDKNGTL